MMHKAMKSYFVVVGLLSLFGCGIDAAIVTVTSLDDALGTTLTLRQAILNAVSGDTIDFGVSGTIFLDEVLGELVVDKELTIDGQNKIIIDGGDLINICFHITNTGTADASNSVITNITIQNFNGHNVNPGSGTAPQALDAFGILIDGSVIDCSVVNTTIKNIHAGIGPSQEAVGIKSFGVLDEVTNNTISNVSSEDNGSGDSGRVAGMLLFGGVASSFSDNTISSISSGFASTNSGNAFGLFLDNQVDSAISNNTVYDVASGTAGNNSGFVYGIFVDDVTLDHAISNNTIYNLSSGSAGNFSATVFGFLFNGIINGDVDGNMIHHLSSGSSPASTSSWVQGIQFTNVVNGGILNNTIHHLTGESFGPFSGYVSGLECYSTMNGSISNNLIYELHNTASSDDTYFVVGMTFYSPVNDEVSNNTIHTLSSGSANSSSGPVYGVSCSVAVSASFVNNSVYNVVSGNAGTTAGDVTGLIFFSDLSGDLLHNTVHNLMSGSADNSFSVHAFFVTGLFGGTCSYNTIEHLAMGAAPNSVESMGGIKLSSVADGTIIECNSVIDLMGNGDIVFGIEITEGDNLTIRSNTINDLESSNAPAHGLLLGANTTFVTNSLIFCNIISSILGNSNNGSGITVTGNGSVGNDILYNSIFDINGKAITIETVSDATIALRSVFCFDGCKLMVRFNLESLLGSENGSEIEEFLIQFFVSDSKNPSQTKTFIGEKKVALGTCIVRFVPIAPVDYGQFITATATALPLGSDEENNNTSEVSNALLACKPTSHFCPCPEMVPDETCLPCVAS